MLSVTPPGHESRRLDLHQHRPVYRTGASLFGHVGKYASGPEGRKRFHIYFSSSTFQYASLTNFDQLSIRTSFSA